MNFVIRKESRPPQGLLLMASCCFPPSPVLLGKESSPLALAPHAGGSWGWQLSLGLGPELHWKGAVYTGCCCPSALHLCPVLFPSACTRKLLLETGALWHKQRAGSGAASVRRPCTWASGERALQQAVPRAPHATGPRRDASWRGLPSRVGLASLFRPGDSPYPSSRLVSRSIALA